MKKELLSSIFKKRKFALFFSAFILVFLMFAFASAGGNIFIYYLVKFATGIAILIIMFFLFALINKNHIRKIKNNKKLFLFGIIPFLITAVLIIAVSIVSFLCVSRTSLSLGTLNDLIRNFFNWTLGALLIYSILIVLVGIYFIFKKNKDMGYGFLKLGISTFGAFWIVRVVINMIGSGPADYM